MLIYIHKNVLLQIMKLKIVANLNQKFDNGSFVNKHII